MNVKKIIKESFWIDLVPIITIVTLGFFSVLKWRLGIIPALLGGIVAAFFISFMRGHSLRKIEEAMAEGLKSIFPALLTIILVGFIISSWIVGGIIPTMVFYGFTMLNFDYFLPSAMLLTGLTALITGTSFTSIGTIGVSMMIIGGQIGFPSHITAGAIVSGAFLGDKMSPLSDTTNIAASLGKVDLFEHIRHMMWDTIPAFIVSLFIFHRIGTGIHMSGDSVQIAAFLESLAVSFNISPLLFAAPLIIVVMGIKKVPSNIVLFTAVVLGFVSGLLFQPFKIVDMMKNIVAGVKMNFADPSLIKLFSKGGISEVSSTAITIIFIGCIVGIIRECELLKNLFEKIKSVVKSSRQLNMAVFIVSILIGFTTGAQLLAIILPISLFLPIAEEMGVDNKNLTRTVESTGTVGITFVPWSVPGMFIAGTLDVKMEMVLPFLVFPMVLLAFNLMFNIRNKKIYEGGVVR